MEGDAAHMRVKRAWLAMLNKGSLTFEKPLFDQPVQISVEKIEWQEYSTWHIMSLLYCSLYIKKEVGSYIEYNV